MSITPPGVEEGEPVSLDQAGPIEFRDPVVREEFKKGTVWAGVVVP
jgi:hypothetical protein